MKYTEHFTITMKQEKVVSLVGLVITLETAIIPQHITSFPLKLCWQISNNTTLYGYVYKVGDNICIRNLVVRKQLYKTNWHRLIGKIIKLDFTSVKQEVLEYLQLNEKLLLHSGIVVE